MAATPTCTDIPDVALHCIGGAEIDPADLRGQKVVIFFCPADPAAAARELADFRALAADFERAGVWLFGVLEGPIPPLPTDRKGEPHIVLAQDEDGKAWSHFEPALECAGKPDRSAGAAFFFERWGTLGKAWPSSGHARDALDAARDRG